MNGRDAITLVARREIRERLRSRAFLYSTLFLLLLVGASSVLAEVFAPDKTFRVAVTAPVPDGLDGALRRAAEPFDTDVGIRVVGSTEAGRSALEEERVDALLLLGQDRLVFRMDVDPERAAITELAVREVRQRLPQEPELTATTLDAGESEPSDAEAIVAVFAAALLLGSLAFYGQWVLVGVVEEKSNRVVELILSTIQPRHLMAGKVIGIGLLGLAQLALVAGLGAVLLAAGAFDAPAGLAGSVALIVPWFALGFALYAVAFAAAGALASRQQDASAAGQPVTMTLVATYFIGYAALTADPNGLLSEVLTVFPVTAPLILPARDALVGVPVWEQALAVVLILGSIYGLVRVAGRIYARGLLHGGARLDLRSAWRLSRHA